MANYPGTETEQRFERDQLQSFVAAIFAGCGMTTADAALIADQLVSADLRGIHSHGVIRVPGYADRLLAGGIDPRARPHVVTDRGSALVIDGANSMGQVGSAFAMARAIERARTTNVAVATLGGSNHAGALEYFARMAIAADMVGIVTTNALPTMAPWGGIDKLVGLNPIGVGIPGGAGGPLVLDFAFGATAHGKMQVYKQKGMPIPEGWAFDQDGRPTTDIDAALKGLVQPIGQYKGIGLAVTAGILSTLLCDAGYGTESGNMVDGPKLGRDGQFFLALNIAGFVEIDGFKARMDRIVSEYRGTRLAPGCARVYVPGQLEDEIAARQAVEGIPLNDSTIAGLKDAAERAGVPTAIVT